MHSLDPPYAHNDVKPGNVLLTRRKGQPPLAILMDFGSARPSRKQIRSRQEALQLQVLYPSLINTHYEPLRSCYYSVFCIYIIPFLIGHELVMFCCEFFHVFLTLIGMDI